MTFKSIELEILDSMRRSCLYPFIEKAFEHLHPAQIFQRSWHVEAIAYALERVACGEIKRLLITVPPRHGKSIATAVALPAWLLGNHPTLKILVASYGSDLANKHAGDFRSVVTSPWYRALFPGMQLKQGGDRKDEQITTSHGMRKAVSLGGAVTGFGADLIIVDDLMKASDANSPVERQRVGDYYDQTLLSRLDDKANGCIIVIQQRLHEDDLPGYLIQSGRFVHLNLPAIAMSDEVIPISPREVHPRRSGEALCPERESLATLENLRIEMGSAAFSAQYQQEPTPPGGNRFRWEWFGTVSKLPERHELTYVVQSWDTGMTAEPTSDYSVCTTWGRQGKNWILLDVFRQRLDFADLIDNVRALRARWQADEVVIEKAGSGIMLLRQLNQEAEWGDRYRPYTPKIDKRLRAEAQGARLQSGLFLVPSKADWLEVFRREIQAFPMGGYDDQVDSMVQFLEHVHSARFPGNTPRDPVTGRPLRVNRPQRTGGRLPR